MVPTERSGNSLWCKKSNDSLWIEDAKLKKIRYGFYKGSLYMIIITFEGEENFKSLMKTFKEQYGPRPFELSSGDFGWTGRLVDVSVIRPTATKDGTVGFTYTPIQKLDAVDAAAARAGAKGL